VSANSSNSVLKISSPVNTEPLSSEAPVEQNPQAESHTEPDTDSEFEPHRLFVRRSALCVMCLKLTRLWHDGDSRFSDSSK